MKKSVFTVMAVLMIALATMAFTYSYNQVNQPPQEQAQAFFPEDVQKALETSCFACHSNDGSNIKAKSKLNFSKWDDYSDAKKVGKMEDIKDEVTSAKMPPEKFIAKNPDHALSQEQKDLISKWVTEETAKLMGE